MTKKSKREIERKDAREYRRIGRCMLRVINERKPAKKVGK
jgi:hypothetical protein